MFTIRSILLLAVFIIPSFAHAQVSLEEHAERVSLPDLDAMYVGVFGGVLFSDTLKGSDSTFGSNAYRVEFDPGLSAGAEVGFRNGTGRFGLEFMFNHLDIDQIGLLDLDADVSGRIQSFSFMLEALVYLDTDPWSTVRPYFGGGLGFSHLSVDIDGEEDDDFTFAWHGTVGVEFGNTLANKGYVMFVGYKLSGMTDPDFDGVEFNDFLTHAVEFGVRFDF